MAAASPDWGRRDRAGVGILLVGHGSHLSPDSASPVHDLARRLRRLGQFDEVRAAFWKEEPALRFALDRMESRDVRVVPVFTSAGYFTNQVVPRELGIPPEAGQVGGRAVRFTPPVGTHPSIAGVVLERAREVAPLSQSREMGATLVVIGHGTDLHPDSADSTNAVVERLREEAPYGRVVPAFLDQTPRIGEVLSEVPSRDVILVPFFISSGWHTESSIPEALGLRGPRTRKGDQDLWYARAVGTHPSMVRVVQELVSESLRQHPFGPPPGTGSGAAVLDVALAKEAFLAALPERSGPSLDLLEVTVGSTSEGRFDLRHIEDRGRPSSELRELTDPEDVVQLATTSRLGGHRPLRTRPDLSSGWQLKELDPEQLWQALDDLYPGLLLHRFLARVGRLPVTPFAAFAARQTGIHSRVSQLPEEAVRSLVADCCGGANCLRTPLWATDPLDDLPRLEVQAPCAEACSVFLSRAREALDAPGNPD